jgi:hypothetical protein
MILTEQEAKNMLMLDPETTYPQLAIVLPAIDEYIKTATGFDWGTLTAEYTAVDPVAKMAASILLSQWYFNPLEMGKDNYAVVGFVGQLQAKVLPPEVIT